MNAKKRISLLCFSVVFLLADGSTYAADPDLKGLVSFDLQVDPITFIGRRHGLNQSEVAAFAKGVLTRSGISIVDTVGVYRKGTKLKRPLISIQIMNDTEFDDASLYMADISLKVIENATINGNETTAVIFATVSLLYTEYGKVPTVKKMVGNAMTVSLQHFAQAYKKAQ